MEQPSGTVQLNYMWDELINLIRHPGTDIRGVLLLLAVAIIIIFLVALTIALAASGRTSRKRKRMRAELEYYLAVLRDEDECEVEGGGTVVRPKRPPEPLRWQDRVFQIGIAVAVLVVVMIAVGIAGASPAVCTACHESTPHSAVVSAGGVDPHASVGCVRCHEGSGWLGHATIEVPQRLLHVVSRMADQSRPTHYGLVVSSACLRCHEFVLDETTEDTIRGIRMSHREPHEAKAECRDCHTLATGVVSSQIPGMGPCLRCHDGENQPTTCSICHTKDASVATRTGRNVAQMTGRPLVPNPECGSCHDLVTQCDPCHGGVRMPHTEVFMWWGHAREGAKDVWFNGGRKCAECHTAERRPCTGCHRFFPGHPTTYWPRNHGNAGTANSCNGCHGRQAYVSGRDFCKLCHGEPLIDR